MKYELYRKDFKIYRDDIHLLPTIRIAINNPMYVQNNFSVEFYFLTFHSRLLFMQER